MEFLAYTTGMIKRFGYTLCKAWQHRKLLRAFDQEPTRQIGTVFDLNLGLEKAQGIKVLILDMDGVLTCYGEERPGTSIESWLNSCIQIFGEGCIFILSNKPTQERASYFKTHFKGVELIFPTRKKPYPDGINQILELTKTDPHSVLVIDDRLLTGVLAAILSHTEARLVTKPLICLNLRPIPELFFIVLRKIERVLFDF